MSKLDGLDGEKERSHDASVVAVAAIFELHPEVVMEDLAQLARWRRAAGARLMLPWLRARHGWDDDEAHCYLSALERAL